MKIDSIFSTFDCKIEALSVRLDMHTTLYDDNLHRIRNAYMTYCRLLVDAAFSKDHVYLWGLVSSFYTCIKKLPLLDIQDCLNFTHEVIITSDKIKTLSHFKGEFFGKYGSKSDSCIYVWPFLNSFVDRALKNVPHAYFYLACVCKFLSKLELDRPSLEADCIQSYIDCEDHLSSLPPISDNLLVKLNEIMKKWLKDYDPHFLPVRHGSGSVANCRSYQLDKYLHMSTDRRLNIGIGWLHDLDASSYLPVEHPGRLVRTSKYITVPKSLTKRRGISMEPATLQYFQQGVMITLYDYIEKHIHQIPIRNQETNQTCAFLGSKYGYYCTVDLSNASDLVSYSLVKSVFKGTNLLKYLIATRSDSTLLPNGTTLKLKKFAPMGSALCFPIESLIFACVCEYVAQYACENWGLSDITYSVYGDDMIINNCLYSPLCLVLRTLGFKVNQEKSFSTGPFRESCGAEFRNGIDVTPVRYRLTVSDWKHISPREYSGISSFANACAASGFFETRKFLLEKIVSKRPGPLFVDNFGRDPFIFSTHATNFNNNHYWNKDYQRKEIKYLSIRNRVDTSLTFTVDCKYLELVQQILYDQWLIQRGYNPNQISEHEPDKYSLVRGDVVYHKTKILW